MKLAAIIYKDVFKAIEEDLHIDGPSESTLIAAICEHLRASVTLNAAEYWDKCHYPVPTVRLTQPLISRIEPLLPDSEINRTAVISEQLTHLGLLRDLIQVDGKWHIGPPRLISIDSTNFLLIGGGPLCTMPYLVRNELQIEGRARILTVTEINKNILNSFPIQRLEDWLETPGCDLKEWAEAFQKKCIKYGNAIDQTEDIVVYKLGRWIPLQQYRGSRSILLFRRPVMKFGTRAFAYGLAKVLASFEAPPEVLVVADIDKEDARRLQGAIQDDGRKNRIEYWVHGSRVLVRIPHPLPKPESRFLSLGWSTTKNTAEMPWPKNLFFSKRLLPFISKVCDCLGYELKQKN